MNLSLRTTVALVAAAAWSGSPLVAEATLVRNGTEYRILPQLDGDQVRSHMSFNQEGGYLVTQDNTADGDGLGIRARQFTASLSGAGSTLVVNSHTKGDQENPRVAALPNGGAAFVWQSGGEVGKRIYARFLLPSGQFNGRESWVSAGGGETEMNPAASAFADSSVVFVWSNYGKDGSLQGIFGRRFSSTGTPLTGEFQVNQFTQFNQRDPAVAALENGNFVVTWISEGQGHSERVDVFARIFDSEGQPVGSEFRVNTGGCAEEVCDDIASNPDVVAVGESGFIVAWSQRPGDGSGNWNVHGRAYNLSGTAAGAPVRLNTYTENAQYQPRLAVMGGTILAVWTSQWQDGADAGVYGQVFRYPLVAEGEEFRVNTTTASTQFNPAVAGVGTGEFVVAWSSFTGGIASFDLFAQRYKQGASLELAAPDAPYVFAIDQQRLMVSWPEVMGQPVGRYLLYVDGSDVAVPATGCWQIIHNEDWAAGSLHFVEMAYELTDGKVSPKSLAGVGRTWGVDENGDGLPDDWQREHWGRVWPGAHEDSDGDGATNLQEFLAGTDPLDPNSVLKTALVQREHGLYLDWNTTPGNVYQVQGTPDLKMWTNIGNPRFAHGATDSILVSAPAGGLYFRVIRMR